MARTGRPNNYGPEELQAKVDQYFIEVEEAGKMPSFCGLALYLGYTSETSLRRYVEDNSEQKKSDKTELVTIISRAREQIKESNIQALYDRDMSRGAQFVLQNGFGWAQKQEIRHDAVINVKITDD